MSSKIYYFSGTGNSLAISRKLEEFLIDKGSLLPLSTFENEEIIDVDADVLGFVFPVYFMTVPDIVKTFVKKLNFKTNPYIFAIATCNGVPGHSLFTLNKCLNIKGNKLSSGFAIDMPGNALITPSEIEALRLKNSTTIVAEIASYINNQITNEFEGEDTFKSHLESFVTGVLGRKFYIPTQKFSSTSECIGCGLCEKVCPVKNIKIVNNRPQWQTHCSRCLACFHWCPKKAVTVGKILTKRNKYHHPEVSVVDMYLR